MIGDQLTSLEAAPFTQGFLTKFFPPLPEYMPPVPVSPEISTHQLPMTLITEEEVTKAVFSAAPLKGAGPDTISAIVWQKLWPTIKDSVIRLFITSIELSIMPDHVEK